MDSTRYGWVMVCLGLTLCAPAAARADAEKLLQESMIRYRLGEFRPALKLARRARRAARKKPKILARVYMQVGVLHAVLRKKRKAHKAFRKALVLDPTSELGAGDTKAAVRRLFKKAHAGVRGSLLVTSDRPGALVRLNGKEAGKAPHSGKLPVGRYRITVATADGLYRYQQAIVVHHKQQTEVVGKLAFVGARLNVISLPPGATVKVDGKVVGKTPLAGWALAAGKHELRVEMAGRMPFVQQLNLKPGDRPSMAATLTEVWKKPPAPPPEPTPAKVPASSPAPPAPVEPTEAPPTKGIFPLWTAVCGGAALALVGVGIGMGAASSSAFEEYKTTDDIGRYFDLQDQIKTYDTVMAVSYAAAGALAITAAVLYLTVERKGRTEKRARLVPLLGPGSVGLSFSY